MCNINFLPYFNVYISYKICIQCSMIHVCAAPTWVLTQIEVGPAPSTIYCESPCASPRCRQESTLTNMAMPSFIVSLCRLAWNHFIEARKTSCNALCTWFAMADPQMQIVTSNLDSGGLRGFCLHLVITNVSPQVVPLAVFFVKGRSCFYVSSHGLLLCVSPRRQLDSLAGWCWCIRFLSFVCQNYFVFAFLFIPLSPALDALSGSCCRVFTDVRDLSPKLVIEPARSLYYAPFVFSSWITLINVSPKCFSSLSFVSYLMCTYSSCIFNMKTVCCHKSMDLGILAAR